MASDIRLHDNAVVVDGNVGIGTAAPVRPLHVEGNEIHSGGAGAGLSFADRNSKAFVSNPQQGERWVWYAQGKVAHLWSGRNILTISEFDGSVSASHIFAKSGSFPEGLNAAVRELTTKSEAIDCRAQGLALTHPKAPRRVHVPIETEIVTTETTRQQAAVAAESALPPFPTPGPGPRPDLPPTVEVPPRIALYHDFGKDKDKLVLNHHGRYAQGVQIEGNVHVTGALTHASSLALKDNITVLSAQAAMAALHDLQPVTFTYKADTQKQQHAGFIAEEVPDLVAKEDHKAVGSMDVVAVLTAVVQEQQRMIAELASSIERLMPQKARG